VSTVEPPIESSTPYGRRAFVGIVATGLSSLIWGDAALRGLSQLLQPVTSQLPKSVSAALPSPDSGWRIYSVNPPMPTFDEASWRLRIDGLVRHPMDLTYADLRAMAGAQQVADFHCVTGWSVPHVGWTGVRFKELLAAAQPLPGAGALQFVSAERPYVDSLSIEQALVPDAMLALDMDGKPLTREHGAPARVVMPKMYGYKNVKWVNQITVTRAAAEGFWEQRGYDRDAWVGRSNGV
jgi:DMSO/TMAO reductase YedYZ molybdopterin-dependent catalytic subunit